MFLLPPLSAPRDPPFNEEEAAPAAASEEEADASSDDEGDEEEAVGGAHEPTRTISASCGGKGPRQPPVAASHACEEPRIVAT